MRPPNSVPDGPPLPDRWGGKSKEIREGQRKYYERDDKQRKLFQVGKCKGCRHLDVIDLGYGGFSQICPILEAEDCPHKFVC